MLPADIKDYVIWLPAKQKQAAGMTEAAASQYMSILKSVEEAGCSPPDEALAFVAAQASQAYADLPDWEGLEAFFEYLEV